MLNICLDTDSYKVNHWNQYLPGTEKIYSYFESRLGARFPVTVFFGLQYIIKRHLEGRRVTLTHIDEADSLLSHHFGDNTFFNKPAWKYIAEEYDGRLPVSIRAVPEGTVVPVNNVLMTVENTDSKCYWLTNYLETLLAEVWYPCTVATLSYTVKQIIKHYLTKTSDNVGGLSYMLHDFGYRGVSSYESACIGGMAHLVNFVGTDTIPAIKTAIEYYNATKDIGASVAATEHSIMTSAGSSGESTVVKYLLEKYPKGILSVVGDSYNIENFVSEIIGKQLKEDILRREGIFVIRPDSLRHDKDKPSDQVVWIAKQLATDFGYSVNSKGYTVINPKVRILWGDGIDIDGITTILSAMEKNKFSVENIATFGMGGGLLQKINRDTQRFAFKCSAQKRNGHWRDIYKKPLDTSKASKAGRLALVLNPKTNILETRTVPYHETEHNNLLVEVFRDGVLRKEYDFYDIRERAKNG